MDTTGQDFANKAADKAQEGLQGSKKFADQTADTLSGKVETLRSQAGPAIDRVTQKGQVLARQSIDAIGNASQAVRDTAVDLSDSVIAYTKENPVKALLWAAATGALAVTLIQALTPSRD